MAFLFNPFTGTLDIVNSTGVLTVAAVGAVPNTAGAAIAGTVLTLEPADSTHPGVITSGTQTIGGAKTFSSTISASNLSGTNTGDISLTAVGSTPSANGASLSGQDLTLQPADATHPGALTTAAQTFGGAKTMLNDIHTGYSEYNVISTPSTPGAGIQRLYSVYSYSGENRLASISASGNELFLNQDLANEAYNGTGSTLLKGKAVLVQGVQAGNPSVVLAQANTLAGSLVYGLVASNITNTSTGTILSNGELVGVDTSSFAVGDTLYLSTVTPGLLVNSAPTFPSLITKIGTVLVSNASTGVILIAIVNAVPIPVATTNIPFYFSATASTDIATYDQIVTAPITSAEVIFTGTGVGGDVKTLIKAFATEVGTPSVVTLPTGTWFPKIYAKTSNISGSNLLYVDVYKRASGGTETLLYTITTPELTTTVTQYDLDTAQSAFTLLSTDRLVFKVSYSISSAGHTISFYTQDGSHNSVIISTLAAAIGVELQANKDTANGYAGLTGSTLLKTVEFPPFTGDVTTSSGTVTSTVAKIQGTVVSGTTGSTNVVFSTSPTLVTPALGTPSALVGTNITGTAAGLTAGNVTTNANLTGAVTSVGNATSLGSFTSAQLATALTDETGSGASVFATSPTLVTPILGTPSSGTLTSCTGLPLTTGITGTLGVANGGTGSTIDIAPTSFAAANNQSSVANVTGLAFANGTVRSFEALVSIYINATSALYEVYTLRGIQKGASWDLAQTSNGDASLVVFSITSAGQIQYTSSNSSGFVANTMKFRAICTAV